MCGKSVEDCAACIKDTVEILQNVGFSINVEMSVLVPIKCIEYLGNIIDSDAIHDRHTPCSSSGEDCGILFILDH